VGDRHCRLPRFTLQIEDPIVDLQGATLERMYRQRTLSGTIGRALRTFPALIITGPRQAGKTTLLRTSFGKTHRYVSLDHPHVRERAMADPVGFLDDNAPPVILDEIQHAPTLLPYIKAAIDQDRVAGRWILSGSQAFPLMQGVTESLAGRVAVLTLLPFSSGEAAGRAHARITLGALLDRAFAAREAPKGRRIGIGQWMLRGGYPEPWTHRSMDRRAWMASYVQTYLERDVRAVLRVADLGTFQVFVRLLAARTGQMLSLADLARDAGISAPTAKQWVNVLEASHQVLLVRPYHRNFGKRLVKAPKVYWLDTGLAAWLAGQHDEEAVLHGPMAGALFETAVVSELAKAFLHRGMPPELWYWRSRDGWEVDLLVAHRGKLHPVELKLTSTPRPQHGAAAARWRAMAGDEAGSGLVVANVREPTSLLPGIRVTSWDMLG
jgi:predicted AAA+ superfamily ATPase